MHKKEITGKTTAGKPAFQKRNSGQKSEMQQFGEKQNGLKKAKEHEASEEYESRPKRDGRSSRDTKPARDGRPVREGSTDRSARPAREGSVDRSARPARDGSADRSARPTREGSADRSARPARDERGPRDRKVSEKPVAEKGSTEKRTYEKGEKNGKPKKKGGFSGTPQRKIHAPKKQTEGRTSSRLENEFAQEKGVKLKKQIEEILAHPEYQPMKLKELAVLLSLPADQKEQLESLMKVLMREGKVVLTKRGKYILNKENHVVVGKFIAHQKGFGFVEVEGEEEDVFIPAQDVHGAFHGDTVSIQVTKSAAEGRRKEGKIVEIVERGRNEMVGTFQKNQNFGFVVLDNRKYTKDIFVSKDLDMGAISGHKVVVRILSWGSEERKPEGEIIEIIGHSNDPGVDILAIVKSYNIPTQFPDIVMQHVAYIENEVSEEERARRLDIREWPTVTIDGEDAKDLDDAITLTKEAHEYILGVHIADVSHYVTERSALDEEALERGTSVYLVDRVIPMLPHKLSNGICSLNAGEDRLALSCIMHVNMQGVVTSHEIKETVINVDRRMTYTNVKKILTDKDPEVMATYSDFLDMFKNMEDLAQILRAKRKVRGSIDFDFPEAKVILNEQGELIDIRPYERNVATKIIEDFMLLANETVAENFFWQELPFVYRSHEEPDPEKIRNLSEFIYNFGYHIKGKDEVHPKVFQKLLIDIEGSKEEPVISRLALRSMKQARYTTTCDGHFGLATKYYCHFTSPIRRYPDLQIHRIIKESLAGKITEKRIAHYEHILPKVAKMSSELERRAEETERETIKMKKVAFMEKHIGETFKGIISGITNWGMYVELENTVEGLIHVTSMQDDYYNFDEKLHCFIGERTNTIYHLGDTLIVRCTGADKLQRTIDFAVIGPYVDEAEEKKDADSVAVNEVENASNEPENSEN